MSWRPDGWPKNPCDGCSRKRIDDFGLICDIACGEGSAYHNFEAGADAMLEGLKKSGDYRKAGWYDDIGELDEPCWMVLIPDDTPDPSPARP